jgi:hypothetical protein
MCAYLLSPSDVWNAHNGAVHNVGVAEEVSLNLQGTDLEAARLDDINRRPANNFKSLALCETGGVARSEPAIICELFSCRLGLVEVAAEHGRSLDQQLSLHLSTFTRIDTADHFTVSVGPIPQSFLVAKF